MEQRLLERCREAVSQVAGHPVEISMDTPLSQEAEIDSLAFMNIIIAWEICLEQELDDRLLELRKARTVGEAIHLVVDCPA